MTYAEFMESLKLEQPPASMPALLQALWHDGKGDWEASHNVAQDIHDRNGSWIHAYLHRKEGDLSNARYWYSMAGRPESRTSLKEEWEALVREFVK